MRVVIKNSANELLVYAAKYVVESIHDFAPSENRFFTMVLPTPTEQNAALYGVDPFRHV